MAIIVDKVQKKKDIACACKDLFIKKGLSNITIAEVAQTAGVGKGTIYEYFQNKEEILFEIANILMQKHEEKLKVELVNNICTKEKIKKFSEFFYNEEDVQLREIYKEFTSISLANPNEEIKAFQTQANDHFYELFREIIEDGVQKGELVKESLDLSLGIYSTGKGLFLMSSITSSIADLKKELDLYIDTIFKLMEVKK
jgi:AcrR family transcriptional regulator